MFNRSSYLLVLILLALVMVIVLPIAAPDKAPQAQAGDWAWSDWRSDRVYVTGWGNVSDPSAHYFRWQDRRWDLYAPSANCIPGYTCNDGYLRVRYWMDHDLGWSYMQCPCGRIFRTRYVHRGWWW